MIRESEWRGRYSWETIADQYFPGRYHYQIASFWFNEILAEREAEAKSRQGGPASQILTRIPSVQRD